MLQVLIKKQLAEIFRSYFYDEKKSRMRPKWQIACWFLFFIVIMAGMLGGIFTYLSLTLCGSFVQVGVGWLYFVLMCIIAIMLGAFGSVFNTFASLYLAKDNDLLLSLPIPVQTIMASRLINVYLMGTMYCSTVMIPALIVYWVTAGLTVPVFICGLLLYLIVTVIIFMLSCLLGWAAARISLKLKNKSFITVLVSILFIAAYYYFYFNANGLINDILLNAVIYGEKIRGSAYLLYMFGRIGEGDFPAAGLFLAAAVICLALIWTVMKRSFLTIAASGNVTEKKQYVEKTVREKSVFGALLAKEFARFTSSANYMLNCGLGILLIPMGGVLFLVKGRQIFTLLDEVFTARSGASAVLACTMLCTMLSMIDTTAPSVSLEGKSIWIPQSMPVSPKTVLRAKMAVQLILSVVPVLFASVCMSSVIKTSAAVKILLIVMPAVYAVFLAVYGTVIGVRMPLMTWTNEMAPIKQGGAVVLILFSSWGFTVLFAGLYFLAGYKIGVLPYLVIFTLLYAAASAILLRWLDTKGADEFSAL